MNTINDIEGRIYRLIEEYGDDWEDVKLYVSASTMNNLLLIRESAIKLREAQRAYMADRGNEDLGAKVGLAAQELDAALAKCLE